MPAPQARKEIFFAQQLTVSDVEIFKSIRLEALQKEPHVFGARFDTESQMTNSEWLDRLVNEGSAYFALKDGPDVVGLTGIITSRDKPTQAILIASYIRQEYRRKGGSELLYKARLDWARAQGFAEVVVSHRASNESSKFANQKHGFEYTHRQAHTWNDGVTEDNVFYKLIL
jgi:RimJ/RimL family protein N-acetyltransferase